VFEKWLDTSIACRRYCPRPIGPPQRYSCCQCRRRGDHSASYYYFFACLIIHLIIPCWGAKEDNIWVFDVLVLLLLASSLPSPSLSFWDCYIEAVKAWPWIALACADLEPQSQSEIIRYSRTEKLCTHSRYFHCKLASDTFTPCYPSSGSWPFFFTCYSSLFLPSDVISTGSNKIMTSGLISVVNIEKSGPRAGWSQTAVKSCTIGHIALGKTPVLCYAIEIECSIGHKISPKLDTATLRSYKQRRRI
jgi:hypothetical protein